MKKRYVLTEGKVKKYPKHLGIKHKYFSNAGAFHVDAGSEIPIGKYRLVLERMQTALKKRGVKL